MLSAWEPLLPGLLPDLCSSFPLNVPVLIKEIQGNAFISAYNLKTVIFDGCEANLTGDEYIFSYPEFVVFDKSLKGMGYCAFYYCNNLCFNGTEKEWNKR